MIIRWSANDIKKCLALIIFIALPFSTATASQDIRITFGNRKLSVGEAIEQIEEQSNYVFVFEDRNFDMHTPVALPTREMALSDALEAMLDGQRVAYVIRNRFIVVTQMAVRPIEPDSVARTGDIYRPTDMSILDSLYSVYPGTETVHYDTIITEGAIKEYPAPFSDYTPADRLAWLQSHRPTVVTKINLLYAGATLTPNLAVEVGTGVRSSVEVAGSYNPWNRKKPTMNADPKQMLHWSVRAEYRHWFCQRFQGHYLGAHVLFMMYNISDNKVPMMFEKYYRYEGTAFGAGITYGYHLPLGKRWGVDFNIGVGALKLDYDRFTCLICDRDPDSRGKTYFGPTRAGINIAFMIN